MFKVSHMYDIVDQDGNVIMAKCVNGLKDLKTNRIVWGFLQFENGSIKKRLNIEFNENQNKLRKIKCKNILMKL